MAMGFLKSIIDTYLDYCVKNASDIKDKSFDDYKREIIPTGIMTCFIVSWAMYLCIQQGVFDQLKFYLILIGTLVFWGIGELLVLLSVKDFREDSKSIPQIWLLGIFLMLAVIMQAFIAREYYDVLVIIDIATLVLFKLYLDIITYRYLKVKVLEGKLSIPLK